MNAELTVATGADYYREHETVIHDILAAIVEGVRPEPGEDPARIFGVILTGLITDDPTRAPIIAALAIMRLAGWVAES